MIDSKAIPITPELLNLISEIDEFRFRRQVLRHLAPERLTQLKKNTLIESTGVALRNDGIKLSDKSIDFLLVHAGKHVLRTEPEEKAAGYAKALEHVFSHAADSAPLTEADIRQLHGMLLRYCSKCPAEEKGLYKKDMNHIEAFDALGNNNGILIRTAVPFETPLLMEQLILWLQTALAEKKLHPLLIIAIFTAWFLVIAPFAHANVRLSRLLTLWLLLKTGYSYAMYRSLDSLIADDTNSYYTALHSTQKKLRENQPNWEPWLMCFFKLLKKQKNDLDEKLDQKKVMSQLLPPLALQILEFTRLYGQTTITQLAQLTQANRNTLKVRLRELVNEGYLVLCGKGRATWYALQ